MAARVTSAFYHFTLILHLFLLINYNYGERFGDRANNLHISSEDAASNRRTPLIINRPQTFDDETSFERTRRDAPTTKTTPNITTKVNALKDAHQQLMVHWVGEGSNVIICLARDSTTPLSRMQPRFQTTTNPSAVYISYDYGDSFENKTDLFKISDEPDAPYASLDKFYNHPKFNTHCVFADIGNNLIFITTDNGKNITRVKLPFQPSEISFHEENPNIFLILDKVNPMRKLWLTMDMGKTWSIFQQFVKAFFWTSTMPRKLLIERIEPTGVNTVLAVEISQHVTSYNFIIGHVEDFQIKGDYMFATIKTTGNNLDLYISYKNQSFVKAEFNSELNRRDYHIADVSHNRVFIAVSHSETIVNLYVSETIDDKTATFTLSLERILTFFPNNTWKDSWLSEVADEAFTDFYKVEGLRGIYIASQVKEIPKVELIGPENLISLITFDHGVTWNPIKPPTATSEGFYIPCTGNCSLHLSQKFSQLYPATRSVSIMSSKSAPGIIMATGVIGTSLKGHPALYVSRDAGLTWKQVMRDYYFFNLGDHGGVLVAVKYFKSRDETNFIYYSTDEGDTWQTSPFSSEVLRVYGLMTEPGENTTVFTMFGSTNGYHQWLIVKVDLKNVFERDCQADDFKFWSPSSSESSGEYTMPCVLGRKEVYQRRAARVNCYINANYDRPIILNPCLCDANDYQCDTGFVRTGNPYHCIRNKSMTHYDPYAIPSTCKPGQFYNRTKGYVKIPDDECFGGLEKNFEPDEIPCPMEEIPEFLLVAQREHISRIDLKQKKLEPFAVHGLKNVIAIEFDMRNNCLYWADIVNDTIGRQCLKDGKSHPEILVETDLSSIEGMALDWVSNVLYFVDGVKMKIEIIKTDVSNMGRMRRTILGPQMLKKPRGIAVHPMLGYMFWTDWAPGDASVSRANLDGTNVKRLFTKPTVEWPNGITIDHIAERIYWVDAREDYIGSSDFEGKRFKKVIMGDDRVSHPFAVAVFKDNMYWDDWKQSMIFVADKDHGVSITSIIGVLPGLMDLKVFAHSVQTGTNKCASNNSCSHICLGAPNNNYVCLCPDGMEMGPDNKCTCPGGIKPYANSTCPQMAHTCAANQFSCSNGICIAELWRCDGENDCGDNSDEADCHKTTCSPGNFQCDGSKCIPRYWVCDLDRDCRDGKDEENCTYMKCTESQFMCKNKRCISHRWKCDGEDDCHDNSDEIDCPIVHPSTCKSDEFVCGKNQTCIPRSWLCDNEPDCMDGSDEVNCDNIKCEQWQFACRSSNGKNHRCIYGTWRCDGDKDCLDGSDEVNCTHVSSPSPTPLPPTTPMNFCNDWMFMCNNKKCVPYWWKCDSVDDCGDDSDEIGCGNLDVPTDVPITTEQPNVCQDNEFMCDNSLCILDAWTCDGTNDCSNGEDELHCDSVLPRGCREDQFMCRTDGSCVPLSNICNDVAECPDRSDELGCHKEDHPSPPTTPSCSPGYIPCDDGTRCFPRTSYCDGKKDCVDGFDEKDCSKNNSRVYQVLHMGVDAGSINATSLYFFWWMPMPTNINFQFLPSIARVESDAKWKNASDWIDDSEYQFNDLQPYTHYNLTVYVKLKGQDIVVPPAQYLNVMTGEGVPSPPWNVNASQRNGTKVEVSWRPPLHPNGPITGYELFITPPIPPMHYTLQKTSFIVDIAFEADTNYSFWVIAKNREYESASSNVANLLFDGSANIDDIQDLVVTETTNNTVSLSWRKVKDVDGYHITARAPTPYPSLKTELSLTNSFVVKNLAPGTKYKFEVNALRKNYIGKFVMVDAATKGTPLPSVSNLDAKLIKAHGTTVKLSWNPPKSKIKWKYGIYYALNMQELFKEARSVTTNLTTAIRDLEACESYVFAVGVVGEYGAGPLSQPITVVTHFNTRAPPKRLRVTHSTEKIDMIIVSWSSSCPTMDEPISYTITVTELTYNNVTTVTLAPTNETAMKTTFSPIQYGAKYSIVIATDVDNAIPSQPVIYEAPPLPAPHQLEVLFEGEKREYIIFWQEPRNTTEHSRHYDILVSEDSRTVNETTAKIFQSDHPSYIYENAKTDVIYSFAVRLVTGEGYRSGLSEIVSIKSPPVAWPVTMNTSNIVSFAIPIFLLIVALSVVLGYFVIRHRRLSNSFTQFANSHYDTRRGQATFPGTADGLDEEDSPVIRGFSDDEPLVIA